MVCLSTTSLMPCTPFVRLDMKTVSMASLYSCRQGRRRPGVVLHQVSDHSKWANTGMPGAHSDTAGQAAKSAMSSDFCCRRLVTRGKLRLHVKHL